jgi:hypothetical protein
MDLTAHGDSINHSDRQAGAECNDQELAIKIADMIEAASGLNPLSTRSLSLDIVDMIRGKPMSAC